MNFQNQYGYYQPNFYNPNGAMSDTLNQFKGQYQPQQMMQGVNPQIQQLQQPVPQVAANNGIIWVQGEAGAKSYLIAPNSTVVLWDSENQTIYIKSADSSGIPSMRTLDWVERGQVPQERTELAEKSTSYQGGNKYVEKQEFEALEAKFEALNKKVEDFNSKNSKKITKNTPNEEEKENG